jgi:hypothetical protein
MVIVSVAGAVVLVAAIALAVVALRPGVVPTGSVALDAVPWATVTRIEAEDGTPQALPAQTSTPVSLTLPPGTYRITLAGPPPNLEARVVTVQVQADGTAAPALERFRTLTLDEYFEQYLASATPDAAGSEDAIASPAATDPAAPSSSEAASTPGSVAPQGAPR